MSSTDDWPMPPVTPRLKMGQLIRYRKTAQGTRFGRSEPKVIVTESREFVIYRVWSSDGKDLGERAVDKGAFEEHYERGVMAQYYDNMEGP